RTGFRRRIRVKADTVATAIRIGDPASYDRGVRAIRETRGVVAAVTDRAILEAKAVVDAAGSGREPGAASPLAGGRQLGRTGVVKRGASVVAVLTGHVLKDAETVIRYHSRKGAGRNPPVEIEPTVSAVERLLERS